MILVLIAGIACFALTGLQVMRGRMLAERDRRFALEAARSSAMGTTAEVRAAPKEWVSARALSARARRQALRSAAARVDSEEATAFVTAVGSSERRGSPLSAILRSQAADCRHRRRLHAEESAQKAPVKMLFPIVIFIFPVMAVVILAPAILGSHGLL